MRALAREAGVGIATLYRHFPARRWMDLFAEWMAAENGMLNTLAAMIDADQIAHADTRDELLAAIDVILRAGAAAGDIRADASAEDIAAATRLSCGESRPRSDTTEDPVYASVELINSSLTERRSLVTSAPAKIHLQRDVCRPKV